MDPTTASTPLAWLRLCTAAGGLTVVAGALWWSGKALPPPSALDEQGVTDWLGTTDPVVAAFALVRLAGLAVATWIAFSGALALIVHLSRLRRLRRLRRLVDRLCFPVVRRLVHGVAGAALAAATLAPGTAGANTATATAARIETASLIALTDPGGLVAPAGDRAVIVGLDPPTSPASDPAGAGAAVPGLPSPTAGETWEIRPGDHLWHVAEATLTRRHRTAPTDPAIAAYVAVLHDANRARLLVADNPDLVVAGQVIDLPPSPALPTN